MSYVLNDLTAKVDNLLKETKDLKEYLTQIFQNLDLKFDTRWDAFMLFAKLGGKHSSSIYYGWDDIPLFPRTNWRGETVNELNWYDDFGIDRYQTMDLVEHGLDSLFDKLWYDEAGNETKMSRTWTSYNDAEPNPLHCLNWALTVYKHPIIIQAAEALMRDGITSFTYDW